MQFPNDDSDKVKQIVLVTAQLQPREALYVSQPYSLAAFNACALKRMQNNAMMEAIARVGYVLTRFQTRGLDIGMKGTIAHPSPLQ